MDPIPEAGDAGLRADHLVLGDEELKDGFVDVAATWPTVVSFMATAQSRRRRTAVRTLQKARKYQRAVHDQARSAHLRLGLIPLVRETFAYFHLKFHPWLGHISRNAPLVSDEYLKELSCTPWRTRSSIFKPLISSASLVGGLYCSVLGYAKEPGLNHPRFIQVGSYSDGTSK